MSVKIHDLVIAPQARPLLGSVPAPADEDIAQLFLLSAALAEGTSEIRRLSRGSEVSPTINALRALGVMVEDHGETTVRVRGASLRGLAAPDRTIDCGSSVRLVHRLAGILVAQPFQTVLAGDAALMPTGVALTAAALRGRGGQMEGVFSAAHVGEVLPPFVVGPLPGGRPLSDVQHELLAPGPEVKEALLLSGMYAGGPTYVRERLVSRDHVERLLQALDVPLRVAGPIVELDPEGWPATLPSFGEDVPGDVAVAALLLGMASIVRGSQVCVRGIGLNPTRTGALEWLRQMGGEVELEVHALRLGEPEGIACASHEPLRAVAMADEMLLRSGDGWPVLVALAARAYGSTELAGLGAIVGLDRGGIERFVVMLRAFGLGAEATAGGMDISGRPEGALSAADIESHGDSRIAVTAIMLGLVGDAPTRIRNVDPLARRFPRLLGTLRALGADVRVEQRDV